MSTLAYADFLDRKSQYGGFDGFTPSSLPDFLFGFQRALVEWSLRKGRSAILADCGLGKSPMLLAWADAVVRHKNRSVLVAAPLAVTAQLAREAERFGFDAVRSHDGRIPSGARIVITNYERLHHFDPAAVVGFVADESSILKSFDGVRRGEITAFARKLPYRLLTTATAAPNDYTELGTSSEALGGLGYIDMLMRFFKNDQNTYAQGGGHRTRFGGPVGAQEKWRFKGHAEESFWRWVASWARALRRPSDLGFSDDRFVLPPLTETEHLVAAQTLPDGLLFADSANDIRAQRAARRRTLHERCEYAAALTVNTGQPALVWCQLNDEGDLLEQMIPGAVQVSGSDADEVKEERLLGFARGDFRVLVTKQKIGAWGLNYQHCAHVVVFPSYSYEQHYQAVRRCWRFGQTRPVHVDIVATEEERGVLATLQRKGRAADRMFDALVTHMHDALTIHRTVTAARLEALPTWL